MCSSDGGLVTDIIKYLYVYFDIHCSPKVDHFVGVSITRDRAKKMTYMSQPGYTRTILQRFHMTGCTPRILPVDPSTRLSKNDTVKTSPKQLPYRDAVLSLMYPMLVSRPDLNFAVGQVFQFCENPSFGQWEAIKRIFAYLQVISLHGICFGKSPEGLLGYTDSDYAGDPATHRSTTSFIFFLHGGPVAWSSR